MQGVYNPIELAIIDDNLGMFKLLCTRKHDNRNKVGSSDTLLSTGKADVVTVIDQVIKPLPTLL